MTPEERLAAAAWAATQEIAGSSAHRARLDEAVEIMAPAETWNDLKQAWRERDMDSSTVAPWGASAARRAAETVVLTGAKFQGPDLPVAVALASHRRALMAAEADPFFGCTAGAPDRGQNGAAGRPVVSGFRAGDYERTDAPPTSGGWTNQFDGKEVFDRLNAQAADRGGVVNMTIEEWRREFGKRTPVVLLAEQCAILPERQAQQSDAFFNRQIDEHGDARRLREENASLRAELRTIRAVINAALGE